MLISFLLISAVYSQTSAKSVFERFYDEGLINFSSKKYDLAQILFNRAVKEAPDFPDGYYALSMAYLMGNNKKESLDVLEKAENLKKNTSKIDFYYSLYYFFSGDMVKAEEYLSRYLINVSPDYPAFNLMALIKLRNNYPVSAEIYLKKIQTDNYIYSKINLSALYIDERKYNDSLNAITGKAIALGSLTESDIEKISDPYILNNLGVVFYNEKIFDKCEYSFILSADKGSADALYNLSVYNISKGLNSKAKDYIYKAIDKDSQNYKFHMLLGIINYLEGSYLEAEKEFSESLALNEREPGIYLCFGNLYIATKEYEKGLKILLKGNQIYPEDYRILNSLAIVCLKMEEPADSEKYLLNAYDLSKGDYSVIYNLAYIYEIKRDYTKSLYYYRLYLKYPAVTSDEKKIVEEKIKSLSVQKQNL